VAPLGNLSVPVRADAKGGEYYLKAQTVKFTYYFDLTTKCTNFV